MSAPSAWRDGIRRVWAAPAVLGGVWLMTVLVSLPLTLAMRDLLADHLGSSLIADQAASGVSLDWMQEFFGQANGIGTTFAPTIIGFGAVLDNLSAFLDSTTRPIVIVCAAAAYLGLWLFLAGGIIDRYARDRATRSHGFFAVSGAFFVRFLRLAILMAIVYGALFRYVHPWLFDDNGVYSKLTREFTVERTAFLVRVALYLAFGLVLAACNLVFDYAKVRAVVEDRRSMIGAVIASLRFIRRNFAAATGLYLSNLALFALTLGVYAIVAPGAGRTGWTMWAGFAVGQLYVLARLAVKLIFWASEAALFQGRLAHAGYVAAAAPAWPESPMVEAIGERET